MKRIICLFLTITLLLTLTACGAQTPPPEVLETRRFTDFCGRTVEVPAQITKVAVSGTGAELLQDEGIKEAFLGKRAK